MLFSLRYLWDVQFRIHFHEGCSASLAFRWLSDSCFTYYQFPPGAPATFTVQVPSSSSTIILKFSHTKTF